MARPVKGAKRTYDSTKRRQQAAGTRQAILAAARTLFLGQGYAGATMQAIADEAGVAVQTVYAAFGTKRELLRQLLEASIVGDEDPAPLYEQAAVRAARSEPDPRRRAAQSAAVSRQIAERVVDVYRILRSAAEADPEMAAVANRIAADRLVEMRESAKVLKGPGKLRDPIDRAADTLFILHSPEVVIQCIDLLGWSMDDYEAWLAEMLLRTAILE